MNADDTSVQGLDQTHHNVLFVMTDQHRVDTLGCYGNSVVETPHLDALAATGARFDRMYTPTAICTPARASLLTGLHPFRHGMLANYEWNSGHREELPDGLPTFSPRLRKAGYNVGHVGKWHVGHNRGPEYYGFDGIHLPGPLNTYNHPDYVKWLDDNQYPPFRVRDAVHAGLNGSETGHLLAARLEQPTEATFEAYLVDRALEQLGDYASDRTATGKPFFLACSFFGPHLPYLIPEEWYDRYESDQVVPPASMAETFAGKPAVQQTYSAYWGADELAIADWRKLIAVYWGYVAMIDQQIGRLFDGLRRHGLWDDTAIVFTADHGEFTGSHRLNDKGPAMYEDIYRIPTIVRVPGAPGTVVSDFCTLTDLNPTVQEIAGLAVDSGSNGRSVLPLVRGERVDGWRREVIAEFHGHHFPYPQRMIRDDRYKLVVNPESVDELYDLKLDPHELYNVAAVPGYAGVRKELTARLYRELHDRGDRMFQWIGFTRDIGDAPRPVLDSSIEKRVSDGERARAEAPE